MADTPPSPDNVTDRTNAGSVAAYVDAAVLVAGLDETAGAVRDRLVGHRFSAVDPVFVLGEGRTLLGAIRFTLLMAASASTPLATLLDRDWPHVGAAASRETAASLAIRHDVPALAVLDHGGAFLGALSATAVMAILRDEHLEDLHHMVGILGRSEQAKSALTAAPHRRALYRLPWLVVGLVGSAAATALMAHAEAELSSHIAVTFFVPAIVYLADAIGTQSEAVSVRGLSLSNGGPWRLLYGEIGTGALLGVALALVAFVGVWGAFGDSALALTVSLSIAVAGTIAASVGFALPWLFQSWGLDPALGSGPVATVIQDVLSLAVYLGLVRVLMI